MIRTLVLSIALFSAVAGAASAQVGREGPPATRKSLIDQGDEKERAACHPDVVKFCKELIKGGDDADVFGILSCLQTNRPKISKACNEVLASHGQ
jgi:hypothetical protein